MMIMMMPYLKPIIRRCILTRREQQFSYPAGISESLRTHGVWGWTGRLCERCEGGGGVATHAHQLVGSWLVVPAGSFHLDKYVSGVICGCYDLLPLWSSLP